MLGKILELGTVFDWISPLIAEVQDAAHGPSHTFLIPEHCGWSGRAIAHLLRRHGVKTWGHMIVNQLLLITVRQTQARWAGYLLQREGIPIYYGPITDASGGTSAPGGPSESPPGWLEDLVSIFGF